MAIVGTAARPAIRLGRYEIVKHLAQGGMAEVYLARTVGIEGFERHVVLKRILPEAAYDQRYVAMFLDEARLAASLHHHNIVQVTDIGEHAGEYFFTMEYVHGEDARSLLAELSHRDELPPLAHVIAIALAAAAGLHHAHEQRGPDRTPLGLIHRDVSPANILIGYDGSVKLADFGIAKTARRRAATETEAGTLKGKVAYMSPEQCVGEAVDRRSDIFSLGIVLYELCTVRRLFKGDNDFLTMTAIVLGYIPPPSQYRPDLPASLEAVILKALAAKPEDRYQTAQELRLALEDVAATLGLTVANTALADYMKHVFGERPEPWLDHQASTGAPIEVDFDGSRSGVVSAPIDTMGSAALETVRLVARGSQPELPAVVIDAPAATSATNEGEVEAVPEHEISERTTTVVPVPIRRRWRPVLGIAAALGSLAAFAVALWSARGGAPVPAALPAALQLPPAAPPIIRASPVQDRVREAPPAIAPEPAELVRPAPIPKKPANKPRPAHRRSK